MSKIKKPYYICLITIVSLLNFMLIFNNNVWCDEAFVMNACKLNFRELTDYIYNVDMRPPVYLYSAKLFSMLFGLSVPALKFFSFIPAVLSMILGATVIDKNWGNGKLYTGTIFILLMGLAPITITKNIEISMYSWTAFCIVASAVFAYNIVFKNAKKSDWFLFVLYALGAATTHYYAVLVEIFIYLFLYIALLIKDKKNIKQCLFSAFATILCYTPILPFFFHQFGAASDLFWIKKTNLGTILQALRMPFQGENRFTFTSEFTMIFWALIIGTFMYLLITSASDFIEKKKTNKDFLFAIACILVIACFLASCLILSKLLRPLFVNRYMYVTIGLLWLYIAIVFGKLLTEKLAAPMCLGLVLCFIMFSYPTLMDREYNTGTDDTTTYLNNAMSEKDILINNIEECMNWNLDYYFPEHETYLNIDLDEFYKNESFDFTTLDTTAWYLSDKGLDIPSEVLESANLSCEVVTSDGLVPVDVDTIDELENIITYNIDSYYYFTIFKITKN